MEVREGRQLDRPTNCRTFLGAEAQPPVRLTTADATLTTPAGHEVIDDSREIALSSPSQST